MKIFVPYTVILPETQACLEPYEYIPVKMVGDDDYHNYFTERWQNGERFINCEHDTIFHNGAIEELEKCPEEWCAFGALGQIQEKRNFVEGATATFALIKFESSFITKCKNVWKERESSIAEVTRIATERIIEFKQNYKLNGDDVDQAIGKTIGPATWKWCDSWLYEYTYPKGIICHQHYPNVINANQRYWGADEDICSVYQDLS